MSEEFNEAQVEEQSGIATATEDEVLSEDRIAELIDTDDEFRKQFEAGKIIPWHTRYRKPQVDQANPNEELPPQEAEPETPTQENDEGMQGLEAEVPVERVFNLKESDLVVKDKDGNILKRFRTPGEVMKSMLNAELFIRQQNQLLNELRAAKLNAPEVAQTTTPASDKVAVPDDPFDPEYLKSLGSKVAKVEDLEKRLAAYEERDRNAQEQAKFEERLNNDFGELNSMQEAIPSLKTQAPIHEIDAAYSRFLEDLGKVAGTDGSLQSNLDVMKVYLSGSGEDADRLRETVATEGLYLPEEYPAYNQLLTIRNQHSKLLQIDPNQTIDETILYLKSKGVIRNQQESEPKPAPVQTPDPARQARSNKVALDARIREAAANQRSERATSVPAGVGSAQGGIDDMSEAEMSRLLDLPASALRADPALKSRVDRLMISLGMAPLNLQVE